MIRTETMVGGVEVRQKSRVAKRVNRLDLEKEGGNERELAMLLGEVSSRLMEYGKGGTVERRLVKIVPMSVRAYEMV